MNPIEILNSLDSSGMRPFSAEEADKFYSKLSYSSLELFHTCPRKWQLSRFYKRQPGDMHTAFGHAVGEAIASIASGAALDAVIFNMYLTFEADLMELHKSKKSFALAVEAAASFKVLWDEQLSVEWEVFYVDGKPAAELGLRVEIGSYTYRGFVDLVLRNKFTGEIAILENKTTGARSAVEAMYGNSNQSLGYAVILDRIIPDLSSYLVLHTVFTSFNSQWNVFPVHKNMVKRANWLRDLIYTVRTIEMYKEDDNFPLHGSGCVSYGKQCGFYGTCDAPTAELVPVIPDYIEEDDSKYHYSFTIEELLEQQMENAA